MSDIAFKKKDIVFDNNIANDKSYDNNNKGLLENINTNLWITANAGSGKTTQLVNRYLLLLDNGVKEEEIICITYTEAGAKEMKERIINKTKEKNIKVDINTLNDSITTIHGFCYKNLCKNNIIDKKANILLSDDGLMDRIIEKIVDYISIDTKNKENSNNKTDFFDNKEKKQIDDALSILSYSQSIEEFNSLIRDIIQNQNQFLMLFNALYKSNNIEDLLKNVDSGKFSSLISQDLQQFLNKKEELERTKKELDNRLKYYHLNDLYNVIGTNILKGNSKNSFKAIEKEMLHNARWWWVAVFNTNGDRRKLEKLKIDITLKNLIQDIQDYLVDIENNKEAETTLSILHFAHIVLKVYQKIKDKMNVITYDDMLFLELQQLSNNNKDALKNIKKIKYLMLDEAQDTSPISWDIVKCLVKNTKCNFFVVGDKKQSIYSFQGAKIEEFEKNAKVFSDISNENNMLFNNEIALNTSYRSIKKILDLADKLCNSNNYDIRSAFAVNYNNINVEELKQYGKDNNVDEAENVEEIKHNVSEKNKNIEVEERDIVYNIDLQAEENNDDEDNAKITDNKSWVKRTESLIFKDQQMKQFAYDISAKINEYISNVNVFAKKKENFAIIVPTTSARNGMIMSIIENLKNKFNLNCKMKFDLEKKSLLFLDLMCFYQFAYLQNDDMNLACLLKSNFFGFTDNDLYEVCASYEKNNWYNTLYDKLKSRAYTNDEFGNKIKYACKVLSVFEQCNTITKITECLEKIVKYDKNNGQYEPIFEKIKKIVINDYELAKKENDFIYDYDIAGFIEKMNKNQTFNEEQNNQENELEHIENNEVFFSTIHGVKGMEFDNVILLDLQEQRYENAGKSNKINFFNNGFFYKISKFKIDNVFGIYGLKKDIEKYKIQIDSEKWRLLYVAITRAKKRFAYFGNVEKTKYGISFFDSIAKDGK